MAQSKILVVGGGIAGMEAVLALTDMVGDRARVSVLAPNDEFLYKPMTVAEPFTHQPAATRELGPALAEVGATLVHGTLAEVDTDQHVVVTGGDERLAYDFLVVCVGGHPRPAYSGVEAFWSNRIDLPVDELIHSAHAAFGRTLALVVPPVMTWSLPIYELALLLRQRSEELGFADLQLRLITPEPAALAVFGTAASAAIEELLHARRISFEAGRSVVQDPSGALHIAPQGLPLEAGAIVSLPVMEGPFIGGLPCDPHGFMPIDEYAGVEGLHDVYAAGDGTNFPVKQGGLATQQADAAAAHIAWRLGVDLEPAPFKPVLRGQLLTGMESLNMKHGLTGGQGEGVASLDYLWWPPEKVAGRYLSAWLTNSTPHDLEPPSQSIEVEVAFPREWHGTPLLTPDP